MMSTSRVPAILILTALSCLLMPSSVANAESSNSDALASRVAELETLVRQLEARVEQLESREGEPVVPAAENITPPSEQEIRTTVVQHLQQADPMPLEFTPTLMGCNRAKVETFSVIEIGTLQKSGSNTLWPVKVKVAGVCMSAFGKPIPFDKEGVFIISQDSFGEWTATPRR